MKHALLVALPVLALLAVNGGGRALAEGSGETRSSDQAFIAELVRIGVLPEGFQLAGQPPTPTPTPTPDHPTLTFEFYRQGPSATGRHHTCVAIASTEDIPALHMVYEVRGSRGTPSTFSYEVTDTLAEDSCNTGISRPSEVDSVHAQVFAARERVRRTYECSRQDSDFSDGLFACTVVGVSDPLPDLGATPKEDSLLYLFVRERRPGWANLYVRSTVDIPKAGLFLRGGVDRPVHGYSEFWPIEYPIHAGVIETLGAWSATSDVAIGWALQADGKVRGLYCAENYEAVIVCDSWTEKVNN